MKVPGDHAKLLLKKASHDLSAARATLAVDEALDMVCFHAQQAVEKSLKAILALHEIDYPRRHDLAELLELINPLTPSLVPFADRILNMTPFAVQIRYDAEFDPVFEQADQALNTANEVYELVEGIVNSAQA
jgi:HEPN domain-containing protein